MESDIEIREIIKKYEALEGIVNEQMHRILNQEEFPQLLITHRVKTLESIKEKMVRKADHYSSVTELKDILGFRAICFFSGDVDRIADKIAGFFRIDKNNTVDKRKLIDARSFGYMSLHSVCALPEGMGELSDLWFEVQIRTMLQHSWAEIEHDLGYKSEIEVPREIRRSFSRAASLLETTDIIFSDIQASLAQYKHKVKANIQQGSPEDVYFDGISLGEFIENNSAYRQFLEEIAAITGAHIANGQYRTENLLLQLDFLKINTIKDMVGVLESQHDLALSLAKASLQDSGLDELSSTAPFYYIFRAVLISGDYSREKINTFFALTTKEEFIISRNTDKILQEREKI